jgi:hypothetical protein
MVLSLVSQGTAIFLVVGGAVFIAWRVWPWWCARDSEERQRRHELLLSQQSIDQSNAVTLAAIAHGVSNPIRVKLINE